jgi:membrane protein DedA with SNARE-associated domain
MEALFHTLTDPTVAHTMAAVLLALLLVSGLGMPIPEDIPLLAAGYLCYLGRDEPGGLSLWFMIPATFVAVLGADFLIYYLGRRYGHHLPKMRLLSRYLTPERLAQAQLKFHNHGGKTLFVARFMPGLRAPAFFSAGVFKIPFWKMLVFDGSAALISVPTLVLLAYIFGAQIAKVRKMAGQVQLAVAVAIVLTIVVIVFWKTRKHRKAATAA